MNFWVRLLTKTIDEAENKCTGRKKKRKFVFGENLEEITFGFKDKLHYEYFNVILDKLIPEVNHRKKAYKELFNLFHFLINFTNVDPEDIRKGAEKLCKFYNCDLNEDFLEECMQFKHYLSNIN